MALAEIGEDELKRFEGHVNAECIGLVKNLKCCYSDVYKSQEVFQLLPGHKATILAMKNQINQFKEHCARNSQNAKQPKTARRKIRTGEEIKSALLLSIQTFSAKWKVPKEIFTRSITDFKEIIKDDRKTYKCLFSCMFCDKIIPVGYKQYWMYTNITKHLRNHYEKGNFTVSIEDADIEMESPDENE